MFRKIYSCLVLGVGMLGAAWFVGCYCGWCARGDDTEEETRIGRGAGPIEKEVSEEKES